MAWKNDNLDKLEAEYAAMSREEQIIDLSKRATTAMKSTQANLVLLAKAASWVPETMELHGDLNHICSLFRDAIRRHETRTMVLECELEAKKNPEKKGEN